MGKWEMIQLIGELKLLLLFSLQDKYLVNLFVSGIIGLSSPQHGNKPHSSPVYLHSAYYTSLYKKTRHLFAGSRSQLADCFKNK